MGAKYQGKLVRREILAGILFLMVWHSPALAASVRVAWDLNPEPNVVDYRVHYGETSRGYDQLVSAGNTNTVTISNLVSGVTYYFALTAYNSLGQESDHSAEVSYEVPILPLGLARLHIQVTPAKQAVLTVTGPAGRTHNIEATDDLQAWTTIGSVTVGAGGSVVFTDTNGPLLGKRYYRTRAVQASGLPINFPQEPFPLGLPISPSQEYREH